MQSIPRPLHDQLSTVLLGCDALADDKQLRALFVIEELLPFRDRLPQAGDAKSHVNRLIEYLLTCKLTDGRSGLVLFLDFLSQQYHPADEKHAKLLILAEQLKGVLESPTTLEPIDDTPATHKILRRFREQTDISLSTNSPKIRALKVPMPVIGQIETLLQNAQPVLITGGAGVGKSGIAYELARNVVESKGVLLLDARRLSHLEHRQGLRAHLDLDDALIDALRKVGGALGCRLIIDQLDSVFQTPCESLLSDLALNSKELPGLEIVVIARNLDRQSDSLSELTRQGFTQVTIVPIDEATSRETLIAVGIASPSQQLINLGTNLLNLDLISRIQAEKPNTDFDALDDEVGLWQAYLETIQAHERVGGNALRARQLRHEACRLAWEGLNRSDRTVLLPSEVTPLQQRLIDWEVLLHEHGLIYRFRHEKLHDFLAAKDAVDRDLSPKDLCTYINPHRTGSVVAWMDKLYVHSEARFRERFISRYLTDENELPFYTKLALLDRYLHIDIASEDPHIIGEILQAVEREPGLRQNFFQAIPHYSWASALWEHDFFASPPLPITDPEGRQLLTHWDVQRYLIAVAADAWEVVIRHVQAIDGDSGYIRWAIEALCHIQPIHAVPLIPRILNWLEDPITAQRIDHPVYALMLRFAQAELEDAAFAMFGAMITPISLPGSTKASFWTQESEIQPRLLNYHDLLSHELPLLRSLNLVKLLKILEGRVRLISDLLTKGARIDTYHERWRSAIEDTDQDDNEHFVDKVLIALRDTLETFVEVDHLTAEHWLSHYLIDNQTILRRLGLHILAKFPDKFPRLVSTQLLTPKNLDDGPIHHELFMLLRSGFISLSASEKAKVIAHIQVGFPPEKEERYRRWLSNHNDADLEGEIASMRRCWIRDRLWMIRDYLPADTLSQLYEIVILEGEPDHPEFHSWTGPMTWGKVSETSPLTEAQIAEMSADELVQQLITWSPPSTQDLYQRLSYEGLAGSVARVVSKNVEHYAEHSYKVATLHPVFAQAILEHLANPNNVPIVLWPVCVQLIELLLEPSPTPIMVELQEFNWTRVRCAIIRLLERGLERQNQLPLTLYNRIESTLLTLLDDKDPDTESDNPPEGYAGHNDPLTVALNHVRPLTLDLLIRYQLVQYHQAHHPLTGEVEGETIPRRLASPIAAALAAHLDPAVEPSWSIRAVFGRHLWTLYWFDPEWTRAHLDQIFPEDDAPQSIRFFMAAWNTFVVSYHHCSDAELFEYLRSKYALAIQYLARGLVTKTLHPSQGLAKHLVAEYLLGNYQIDSPSPSHNLLREFFAQTDADARSQAAWAAWRFCAERPQQFCSRVKSLWAWRLQEIHSANDRTPYQREIGYFAQIPEAIHMQESMASLCALLTASLPYLFGSPTNYGTWEVFETFLAHKVEHEPVAVLDFYQRMVGYQPNPYHFRPNDTRRKILAVGAEHETSRSIALEIINMIAALGEHGYKDIYLRFA